MRKKFMPSFILAIVFSLVFSIMPAFGYAKIGTNMWNPEQGWKRYESTSYGFSYEGYSWGHDYYLSSHYNQYAGSSVKFNVVGTSFRVISKNASSSLSDDISVIIDGKYYGKMNLQAIAHDSPSNPAAPRLAYEVTGLSPGEHSIELIINSSYGKSFIFSAIDVPQQSSLKPYNPNISTPKLSVTSVTYSVYLNETFDVQLRLDNVNNIYAEDFSINYDKSRFQFVSAAADSKLTIVHQENTDTLRFITASKGRYNGINGSSVLVNLKFKAIGVGAGTVDAVKAKIADNGKTELTLAPENIGERTFQVLPSTEYSLKHLGEVAFFYNEDKANLSNNVKSILGDRGPVQDVDLTHIVKIVLANPQYK
ncbi:cohesin domain-containing protein [Paenibacillus assamensis]|uniref:cohesin domain-containing protein n=1 Tax=Paenibacillus assamensis TaxID=311244 RepID=UPI00040809A1|nr:cohesin domain-containing protein [Paenibacillus assamensis]